MIEHSWFKAIDFPPPCACPRPSMRSRHIFVNTDGPRYLQYFYLMFRLFTTQKFRICRLSLLYPRLLAKFGFKSSLKQHFWSNTLRPRYLRLKNERCFAGTYQPRIARTTCKWRNGFVKRKNVFQKNWWK